MHPSDEAVLAETRRQFFGRGARGIGSLALFSLLNNSGALAASDKKADRRTPRAAALRAEGEAVHLSAPGGRAAADGDVRLQAEDEGLFDKDLPDSIRQGQRLTTMTSGPDALSHRALDLQIRAVRQVRRVGLRTAALYGTHGGRYRDHPQHAHRGHQSRAGDHVLPDRLHDRRAALHRLVAQLRAGQHESGSAAFVVLQAKHNHPKANVQAISARLWSAGFLSGQYSGVSLRSARRSGAVHQQSGRRAGGGAPPHAGRAFAR